MIYLDNAATTFPKPPEVIDAAVDFLKNCGASPGRGGYDNALAASQLLFECQENLSKLFSIPTPERIVFTKNATESINAAIFGTVRPNDEIIISSMEHNSVLRASHEATMRGAKLKIANASPNGKIDPAKIESLISDKTKLICLIHSSNVSGSINDIYSVLSIAKKHNVLTLFDLSQSAGIIPIDASDFDMAAFSGHKGLFGMMGTGCLYVREGIDIKPLLYGGTGSYSESARMPDFFPDIFHAGTLNAPGIASLNAGVKFILREGVYEKEEEITHYLYDLLCDIPTISVPGERDRTSAVSIVAKGHDSVILAENLNSMGICVRAGLHCAPLAHRTLGTIQTGTLRFSPGFFTTKAEVEQAVTSLKKIIEN